MLLGGGPAAVVGVAVDRVGLAALARGSGTSSATTWPPTRGRPLVAGLFFAGADGGPRPTGPTSGYYLLVFVAYMVAVSVNFLAVAGYAC